MSLLLIFIIIVGVVVDMIGKQLHPDSKGLSKVDLITASELLAVFILIFLTAKFLKVKFK